MADDLGPIEFPNHQTASPDDDECRMLVGLLLIMQTSQRVKKVLTACGACEAVDVAVPP